MARTPFSPKLCPRLESGRVPRAAIRDYVGQIVEKFHPQKVVLFGSHAYGKPNADSDVDILVVMPAANQINQAIRIGLSVPAPFYLDLIVRTPEKMAHGLKWDDWFCAKS